MAIKTGGFLPMQLLVFCVDVGLFLVKFDYFIQLFPIPGDKPGIITLIILWQINLPVFMVPSEQNYVLIRLKSLVYKLDWYDLSRV